MPFCPHCRFEFLPEVTRCPECGAALVPELPPAEAREMTEADLEPALLCVVAGGFHARLLQTELAAQGIHSRVQPGWSLDPLLGAVGAPPPPLGSGESGLVAIFVNRMDLARARTVYHDFEEVDQVDDAESEEE